MHLGCQIGKATGSAVRYACAKLKLLCTHPHITSFEKDTVMVRNPDKECSSLAFKKDDTLWFRDGNIIFVASDPNTCSTGFRLHKTVIMRQQDTSNVFSSIWKPLSWNIDGCDVVLVDDTAHNFRHIMQIVYDGFE